MALQRHTIISDKIIQILKQAQQPLSIQNILNILKSNTLTPNKSTVYRILEKLKRNNDIQIIPLNNGCNYFEWKKQEHHHHFFCLTCEELTCLNSCLIHSHQIDLQKLVPNQNYTILNHDFNLYGICEKCSK